MLQGVARDLLNTTQPVIANSLVRGTWSSSSDLSEDEEEQAGKMMSGFKNLICPLCLNFLYKCTTTACGHSFCERCLDEYLIIRKVTFNVVNLA